MNYNRKEMGIGSVKYFLNDKLHRTDGPAIEYNDGYRAWYIYDKRHRLDGPAFECPDGYKEYWIHDKYYSVKEFNDYIANLRIPEYFSQ